MLLFDEQGLLTPAEGIPVSVDDLYDELVLPFSDSETRERLFQNWINYNRLLRQEIGADFVQWIDGSFVTKKLNPKDMDLVSLYRPIFFVNLKSGWIIIGLIIGSGRALMRIW